MARPLSNIDPHRNGNGDVAARSNGRDARAGHVQAFESTDGAGDFGSSIDPQELELLRDENQQLRGLIGELEQHLEGLTSQPPTGNADAQRELETLLDEKTDIIRDLHQKLEDLQSQVREQPAPKGPVPHEDELMRLQEELEQERRQLKEDEESMMKQMREMEVQMARERAEIARQRSEMQRLHNEIRHELELAARDGTLRDRLAPLQRRHQEVMTRRGSAVGGPAAAAASATASQPANAEEPGAKNGHARKESGLLRRLFR